jgi:hypothetical protein
MRTSSHTRMAEGGTDGRTEVTMVGWWVGCRALHWVSIPMPMATHTRGFWVGMGAMLLFMGGHRFCASLHPAPNQGQNSRMQGIR